MKVLTAPFDTQAITQMLNVLLGNVRSLPVERALPPILALAELARDGDGLIESTEGWVQVVCGEQCGDYTPVLFAVQLRSRLLLARTAIYNDLAYEVPLLYVARFRARVELLPTRLDVLARHGFPVRPLLLHANRSIRTRLARQGLVLPSRYCGDVYRAVHSELRHEQAAVVSTISRQMFSESWLCTRYGAWMVYGPISPRQFAELLAYNARYPLYLAEKILRGNLPADEITAELALVKLAAGGAR